MPSSREAFLQSIVDMAGSVIVALDLEHRVVEWNHEAELLYQTPRSDALGSKYIDRFIAPEHRALVVADIRKVLDGTPTRNFEDDSILPDGTRRTLIWNVTRMLDAEGRPSGVVAVGQDITERKAVEEKFRLVFEHSPEGLLLGDYGGVVDCNPAALELLGLTSKDQLLKRHPAEYSPPLQPDGQPSREKARAMDKLSRELGVHRFEWMHRRPDGTDVPVEITVRRAPLGNRVISVVSWHDLTERRAMEAQEQELRARLLQAQKMEAVGQLAGGIAHDFNNLLSAIRGSLELALLDLHDEQTVQDELRLALGCADRAAALTRQLLVFSRRRELAMEVLDLALLVREVEGLLRRTIPATIALELELPALAVPVLADRTQLEQVVLNLVVNARDAMPDGGTVRIELREDAVGRRAELVVRDSGCGMDAETLSRVFEPFFTTKPVGRGTGLGLAVVYGVVTQLGGDVRVASEVGHGTAFTVRLPLAAEGVTATEAGHDAQMPRGTETVLLVEDESPVREATRRLLERFGYRVFEAGSGGEALGLWLAHGSDVDLLVTDLRMPQMSGLELVERLQRERPELPAILLSGGERSEEETAAIELRVPLLEKPCPAPRLLAALRAVLDGQA
jgi:PAS domain S-box-containing protein